MQTIGPILFQNLRRAAMAMGLAMFVVFAYKASNEVSSPNIAAGNRRQQALVALNQGQASLSITGLTDAAAVKVVDTVEDKSSRLLGSTQDGAGESPEDADASAGRPSRPRQEKPKGRIISDSVNDKKKAD